MKALSSYTEDQFFKKVADCEKRCCELGTTAYLDIAVYDGIYERPCERSLDWKWNENEEKFFLNETNESIPKGIKIQEKHYNKAEILKAVFKLNETTICRYTTMEYSHLFVFYGLTLIDFVKYQDDNGYRITTILTANSDEFVMSFLTELVPSDSKDIVKYKIGISDGRSMYYREFAVDKFEMDVNKNYNDDFPFKKITEILGRKRSDLILFYGEPGCGKTSFIKWLSHNTDNDYIFIDPSVISSCSDAVLFNFMADNKDSVFVLEDCEKLLESRDGGQNKGIGALLNLTDGVIGDVINIKFICTFNCNIGKLDKALLRKGRLSLKYEFKELSLEKTKALCPEADKPMSLADIYNFGEEVDFSKKEEKRIGF